MRITALLACVALAAPLHGQSASAGDLDIQGRVLLKVYATMLDPGGTGHPVSNLKLAVADGNRTTPMETDAAGVASAWLATGTYRVTGQSPKPWQGRSLTWNVPIDVRAGMRSVNLTQDNATAGAAIVSPSDAVGSVAPKPTPATHVVQSGYRKDPSTAMLLSFLVPGIGQMYAGAPGKGVAFVLADVASLGLATTGILCNARENCSAAANACHTATGVDPNGTPYSYNVCDAPKRHQGNPLLISGVALSLVTQVFSILDARSTARGYNRQHGFVAQLSGARPVFAADPDGTTRVGLVLGFAPGGQ